MGLFGSKAVLSSGSTLSPQGELNIQKIPDVFYGGNNPVIYEQNILGKTVLTGESTKTGSKLSTSSVGAKTFRKSLLLWIIIGVGILVIGGVSAYYIFQYRSATRIPPRTTSAPTFTGVSASQPTSSVFLSIPTSTSSDFSVTSTAPSLISNFLEFPPINLGSTADIDLDQLTDIEEEMYGIDSGTWDTDEDGYYDGQEVTNLYNPRGSAPVKLIDSGLVLEYVNPFSQYRIYYPLNWQRGSVDSEDRQVLFSTATGEFVEVRVFEKTPGTTFASWFQTNAPGEQFNLLSAFTNRFAVEGWKRNDGLVVYFDTTSFVFVLLYHQSDNRAPIPYRSTTEMMYQSFRPTATNRAIPDQVPLVIPTDIPEPSVSGTSF